MPNAGPHAGRTQIERLKKRPDFLKVAAARGKSVTPGLILQARRRPGAAARPAGLPDESGPEPGPQIRVGFTVSRKVGNAVQRNRARRRLRAVAQEILPACGRAGTDYVLIGRRETLARPYAALGEDLRRALRRLNKDTGRRDLSRGPGGKSGKRSG